MKFYCVRQDDAPIEGHCVAGVVDLVIVPTNDRERAKLASVGLRSFVTEDIGECFPCALQSLVDLICSLPRLQGTGVVSRGERSRARSRTDEFVRLEMNDDATQTTP